MVCHRLYPLVCRPPRESHATYATHSSASSDDIPWPKSPNPTPYEVFGLPPTASSTEIKKRYFELVRRYHPDSPLGSHEASQQRLERFREVVRANELLSSAKGRRVYDKDGFGWSDMNVNDIMGDPAHWQGKYEGKFWTPRNAGHSYEESFNGGAFDGKRAQPYYTSNANFAGAILVIMVLAAVVQVSHIQTRTQRASDRRWARHEQVSMNLRHARNHARKSGRKDMIEAFQLRRDVNSGIHDNGNGGKR